MGDNRISMVHSPKDGIVIVERRSRDAVGAERWDEIDRISNTQSRSEKSHLHIFELLAKGKAP